MPVKVRQAASDLTGVYVESMPIQKSRLDLTSLSVHQSVNSPVSHYNQSSCFSSYSAFTSHFAPHTFQTLGAKRDCAVTGLTEIEQKVLWHLTQHGMSYKRYYLYQFATSSLCH